MYRGCDCERLNGLQDDCPRTDCHGSPACLTNPPTCGPSEFCNGKHLAEKIQKNGKSKTNSQKGKSNDSNSKNHNNTSVKYECFPAMIKSPVVCCKYELENMCQSCCPEAVVDRN